jgi:hypothetical protein
LQDCSCDHFRRGGIEADDDVLAVDPGVIAAPSQTNVHEGIGVFA